MTEIIIRIRLLRIMMPVKIENLKEWNTQRMQDMQRVQHMRERQIVQDMQLSLIHIYAGFDPGPDL